jgi:imidazolonepropionase-like amidohydrolase
MLRKILITSLFVSLFAGTCIAQIAVKADTLYTMAGAKITDGVVLINNNKIEAVGPASSTEIPDDYQVHEAIVVTPGLIDAHSVVGLAGIKNQDSDQDQLETSSAMQPELRAIDAYNAREELVKFLMNKGITTVHTGHGPGALASGQTMIAKTSYNTVEEAVIDSATMVAFTLGSGISSDFKTPGTDAKGVAILRQQFIKAQEYAEKQSSDDAPSKDLSMEVMADVLEGKIKALFTAQTAQDILTAIRLQKEFGFDLVLDGAAEAYLVMDEIKAAGVPVIIHPTMVRTYGGTKNASFETAGKISETNIPLAFQSGFEAYVPKTRVVLYEAALAAANGLEREAALRALTIEAAKILGIDSRVGSIEEGKDADLVLFDDDPFEYTTHIEKVIIDGKVVKGN